MYKHEKNYQSDQILGFSGLLSKFSCKITFSRYNSEMLRYICNRIKAPMTILTLMAILSVWVTPIWAQSLLPMPVQGAYGGILENNRMADIVEEQALSYNFFESVIYGFFSDENIKTVNVVIGAVAIVYLIVIGIRFILSDGKEEEIKKAQKHFGYFILGLLVISISQIAGFTLFNPAQNVNSDYFVNGNIQEVFYAKAMQVKLLIQILIGGIAMLSIITSAFRIISSTGNEEVIGKEKQLLQNFLFATVLILSAEVIVMGVFYLPGANRDGVTNQAIGIGIEQIMGLITALLSIIAAAALIMIILASLYYVISLGDEDRSGRAKQLIIANLVAIVIVFSAYTILRFFF